MNLTDKKGGYQINMEDIQISVTSTDFDSADAFSKFRNECKSYLTAVDKNWDKFTMVSHDSFIGYITENAIKKYLESKFKGIQITTWEEQFDLEEIKRIIKGNKTDGDSVMLVKNYFYDVWDLSIQGKKVKILSDVKTALTEKEPALWWSDLPPKKWTLRRVGGIIAADLKNEGGVQWKVKGARSSGLIGILRYQP